MKSWYFERDCPFCTRSASSFCRNPLNFLAHAMWMKWWYHANFQPVPSSFEMHVVTDEFLPFCTRSASSFCRNPLNFLAHAMWVKWWYHATFHPFQSSFVVLFSISGSYSSKKSVHAWKINNEVRKGWKSMMWLWMVHFEHTKSQEFK